MDRVHPASPEDVVTHVTHTLSVLGLTYIVQKTEGAWWKGCCFRPKQLRRVLRNVSIHLKSGEVSALLGNSGSGKTSMLDVIACRGKGTIAGGLYLDSELLTASEFTEVAGYVIQDDRLLSNLTVRETLEFTAKLKFPGTVPQDVITQRVDEVISEMGLRNVEDSRIGGAIDRGISGGEKRRVSIAVQLLQNPKILLLDEPTSGLDSFTAHYLIQTLSELAKKKNKIILMTIHQPRSDICNLLDNVGLLTVGELLYFGPVKQIVPYFTSIGYLCPTYSNPLDVYVDLASVDHRSAQKEEASYQRVGELRNIFVKSDIFRDTLACISQSTRAADTVQEVYPWSFSKLENPNGFFYTLGTLIKRMMINLFRDRSSLAVRMFQMSVMSFFIWLYLIRMKTNQASIQDRNGLFYQCLQVPPYVGLLNSVSLFPTLRALYNRECRDGLYGGTVFLIAYFLHILPFQIFSSTLFSTVIYWGVGLYPEFSRYCIFLAVIVIMHYVGEMLGIIFMGIFRNPAVANSITAIILAIAGLISTGLLKSVENMLQFFKWLGWANIFKYASEILVANEFRDLKFDCDPGSSSPCTVPNGNVFLESFYPGSVDNMARNFGAMACFTTGFFFVAFITYKVMGIQILR